MFSYCDVEPRRGLHGADPIGAVSPSGRVTVAAYAMRTLRATLGPVALGLLVEHRLNLGRMRWRGDHHRGDPNRWSARVVDAGDFGDRDVIGRLGWLRVAGLV